MRAGWRRVGWIAASLFAACQPPPSSPPPPTGGAMVGVPWTGPPGTTESVADIMSRTPAPLGPRHMPEYDDIAHPVIADNPNAPLVGSWPNDAVKTGGAAPAPTPALPQTNGLSFVGESSSTDSLQFSPPDSMGAIGPSQYLFFSNGMIRTFNRMGMKDGALDTTDDNFWLSQRTACTSDTNCSCTTPPCGTCGADRKCVTSDPRVFFDHATNRWFLVMIDVANVNRVLIAVSSGPNITSTSSFTFYNFTVDQVGPTPNVDTGDFFDQPTLGVDNLALYIGGNTFGTTTVSTTGFVVNKASILSGGPIVVTAFRGLAVTTCGVKTCSQTTAGPWSPKGVSNNDPASTEGYFIGNDNGASGLLEIRRVSTPGGTPSISANIPLTVPSTFSPADLFNGSNPVPQTGSTATMDGDDARLKTAELRDGHLWAAHEVIVDATGVSSSTITATNRRLGLRFYDITNLTTTPVLNQSGTVFDSTATNPNWYWEPAIVMSGQGHVAIGSSYAGKNVHPGVALSGRLAGDALGTVRAPTLLTSSTVYSGWATSGAQRWGDYSFTSVDPLDNMTMWTAQEFCDANSSWAVKVTQLMAPAPATPTSASPATMVQGTTGSVVVTGTVVNGSGFYDPGSGFPNHIAATVNCTGVTVNSVTYTSPTSITLNVTIAPAAPSNPSCTITVTNPDGQMITSAPIFGCGKSNGASCGGNGECLSNFCVSGICCNSACGSCGSCSTGTCTNLFGPDACSPEVCSGTSPTCPTSCTSDAGCALGFFCSGTTCAASNLANGAACTGSAQCISSFCSSGGTCAPGWDWSTSLTSSDVSAATIFNNVAYYFTDSSVNGLSLATGTAIATAYVAGGAIENFPEVVTLADGKTYVFFTAADGYLYKIDATTLALVSRLKLATAPDVLHATPAVQLAAFSSTNFKTAWGGRDLVYVLTDHASDSTANQLIAVDAAAMTLPAVWQFTGTAGQPMDFGSEGCSIDYATDRLFCGTNQPSGGTQSTAWAFNTVAGTRLWSVNAGSLHNRPQLANGVLYVADMSANLRALDPATGAQKWSLALHAGAQVANNLWAEFRLSPTQVFATDSTGIVYDVVDNGASGALKWQRAFGAAHAITQASVAPTLALAFVGLDDGTLHQLDLTAGADAKHALVLKANAATPGNLVVEPTLAIEGAATDINKMVCSSAGNFGTVTKQLGVPLP